MLQKLALMYFNTSNVTIQQKLVYHEVISLLYFNTSNVTIQQANNKIEAASDTFQYI